MVSCGPNPAPRLVATEPDRQVEQLGGGGRCATAPRGVGRGIERLERGVVRAGRRQGEVAGLELGFGFDGCERSVHGPAARRGRVGVDAAGQQRMGEPDPVAVDADDAVRLDTLQQVDDSLRGGVVEAAQQINGRGGYGCDREQHVAYVAAETPDPQPDQIGQRARQSGLRLQRSPAHGPCQLQRVKRVAAGDFGDAHHHRTGQRLAEIGRDDRMQATEAHRTQLDAREVVGLADSQPRGALVGFAPLAEQHAHPATEPTRRERHHRVTRRVQPLHVVDGHQHGRRRGQRVDDGGQRRCHHPLVGDEPVACGPQQYPVDGQSLHVGQLVERGRLDVAEQVADRGVGEDRFGFAYLSGEDAEPARAGLLDGVQPQVGLADACLTLDDQAGLARFGGSQEVSDGVSFGRPAESTTRHGC
jgi:hypothetical protein